MRGGYQTWPNGPARPGTAWVKRARTPLALSPIKAARTPSPRAVPRNLSTQSHGYHPTPRPPLQIRSYARPPARPPELVAATLLLQPSSPPKGNDVLQNPLPCPNPRPAGPLR
ncbi:hypothetical protein VPH35_080713 [Triticum aestivum]